MDQVGVIRVGCLDWYLALGYIKGPFVNLIGKTTRTKLAQFRKLRTCSAKYSKVIKMINLVTN